MKLLCCLFAVVATLTPAADATETVPLRVYALDCGRADFRNLGPFSDTGEYDGHAGTLMASCFLIRHRDGDLLWDAGLGDHWFGDADTSALPFTPRIPRRLIDQLRAINMGFDDIERFAFSHGHMDHLGNAPNLTTAEWLVNREEHRWLTSTPSPPRTNASLLPAETTRVKFIAGDHDVFGDGSVRILSTPGHTPGHQSLFIMLKSGNLILSGDLFHTRENRAGRRMPVFNVDRAKTLASMDRVEKFAALTGARIVIQHSEEDFASLPTIPDYLE